MESEHASGSFTLGRKETPEGVMQYLVRYTALDVGAEADPDGVFSSGRLFARLLFLTNVSDVCGLALLEARKSSLTRAVGSSRPSLEL